MPGLGHARGAPGRGRRSGTSSPAWRSTTRSSPAGGRRCTGWRSPRWRIRRPASPTSCASPTTRRRPATSTPCCATRPIAGARAAALRAHREAAAQYGRALRFADALDLRARAELLRCYSDSCYLTDRCGEAIDAARELLECHRAAGDRFQEGETLSLVSQLAMCPGSIRDAEPDGRRAIELLEEFPPGPELAMAYANLAAICMNDEDAAGTAHWAARAIELGERCGDADVVVHALNSLGTMEFLAHGPARREHVERSLAMALDAGLDVHVLRAYSNLTWAPWRHRDYALAERYLQAGLARCREPTSTSGGCRCAATAPASGWSRGGSRRRSRRPSRR